MSDDISRPVVNLCLKMRKASSISFGLQRSRKARGPAPLPPPRPSRTLRMLARIWVTLP